MLSLVALLARGGALRLKVTTCWCYPASVSFAPDSNNINCYSSLTSADSGLLLLSLVVGGERHMSTFKIDAVAKLDQPFVPFAPGLGFRVKGKGLGFRL